MSTQESEHLLTELEEAWCDAESEYLVNPQSFRGFWSSLKLSAAVAKQKTRHLHSDRRAK